MPMLTAPPGADEKTGHGLVLESRPTKLARQAPGKGRAGTWGKRLHGQTFQFNADDLVGRVGHLLGQEVGGDLRSVTAQAVSRRAGASRSSS